MSTTRLSRPVTDEPVRGVIAPPWLTSLPGIERMRLYARNMLPATPFARLVGFGIGHVSTGTLTGTLKASGNSVFIPAYNLSALYDMALYAGALTAIDAGFDIEPITITAQYFRPPRPQPGNFLGRARVLNASSVFVSCAAELEDPLGRLVASATSQFAVRKIEPAPPAAPASLEPVQQSTHGTPDPPDRSPVGSLPPADVLARFSGLEITRMIISGELPALPLMHIMGAQWLDADSGTSTFSMPASEWFCNPTRNVEPGAIESLLNMASVGASVTLWSPGQSLAILETTTHFYEPINSDGRELRGKGRVVHRVGDLVFTEAQAIDSQGRTFAIQTAVSALLEPKARRTDEPERVLTALLFTDIVGSTAHAERIGDNAWKSLLEEHHAVIRQALGAHNGREVNTTGDGFLARFESPAAAIRCAKVIRDAVKMLNLEVRAGVHVGECEVHGSDLAGIAVHVAARIVGLAEPNEILVSQTVRDLVGGSGLRFDSRGSHALKGVEGEWNLFKVED